MSLKAKPVSEIEFNNGYTVNRSADTTYTPSSINKEKGTVSAIFATKTRVLRWHPQIGRYWEELSFDEGAIQLSRIKTAAPILNRHRGSEDLGIVLGESVTVKDGRMFGDLRFDIGSEAGKEAFRKVEEGFWRTVSVGYDVFKLRFLEDGPDEYPVYRAELWEPFEISMAPMAADIDSMIRSHQTEDRAKSIFPEIKPKNEPVMEETPEQKIAREKREKEARELDQKEATEGENKRSLEITELATKHGRDLVFVKEHIEKKSTVEQVRAALLEEYTKPEKTPNIRLGGGGIPGVKPEERALYMSEAILVRMDEKAFALPKERLENPFVHRTLLDITMDYVRENKVSETGGIRKVVARALAHAAHQRAGGMSTGDFPYLFENVLKKVLKKDYGFITREWLPLAFKQDATHVNQDEKTVGMSNWTELKEVLEGAEYKRQAVADSQEKFRVKKYGDIFGITIEMIINDDLGSIERMARTFIRTAAFLEDTIMWNNVILGNPNMADGDPVFHANHANLATGAAMTTTTLNELYQKIRVQKDPNGKVINLRPKYIVTGPANEAALDQILNKTIVFTKTSDAVFTYIKMLTPIVTPYITGNAYFVFADPAGIDQIRYGGVVGEPELAIEENANFYNDSYDHKARKFFGGAWTDWKGAAYNPGQ